MSKRRPDVQLTKDNFDRDSDEDVEIINEPRIASQDVLKSRPMVKAKRRIVSDNAEGNGTSGLFSGFKSSFGNSTPGKFNFGSSSFNSSSTPAFGSFFNASNDNKSSVTSTTAENKKESNEPISNNNHIENNLSTANSDTVPENENASIFNINLTKLNQIFFGHISKYMESSSLYDFTVVCQEYVSQFKKLQDDKSTNSATTSNVIKSATTIDNNEVKSKGLFDSTQPTTETSSGFKIPTTFSFGPSAAGAGSFGSTTEQQKPFSFGAGGASTTLFAKNFATSTPLTTKFTLPSSTKEDTNAEGEGAEQEDVPPKVSSVEHTESDSVFTKKCKLYYQKDGNYVEKGLGFLYINVKEGTKPQLLIRAGTATGNILLNIALVESLPIAKAEKGKGVMLTCIPNPEIEPKKKEDEQNGDKKTVTFLIRVRPSDCEELYDTMMKYKSSN